MSQRIFLSRCISKRPLHRLARFISKSILALACGCWLLVPAHAANESWQGNTSANFATPANWSPAVTPSSGDTLSFGAAGSAGTTLNNNLTADTTIGLFAFNGPGSFTIGGNEIQLLGIGNGIINNSTVGQTINAPLVLGDNRNITLTTGGGNVSLGGAISGSGGMTTVLIGTNTPAVLSLSGVNTYTGGTTVGNNSVLNLGNANAVQNSTVTLNTVNTNGLTFAPGIGTFNLGGLSSGGTAGDFALTDGASPVTLSVGLNNANTTFNGVISGAGALVKVGTGTLTLARDESYTGATTLNNGGITLTGTTLPTSSLILGGGTFTINNAPRPLGFRAEPRSTAALRQSPIPPAAFR